MRELGLTKPELKEAYHMLKTVLLPTQARTDLLEFLLESFETGVVESCQGDLVTCFKQLGIWTDESKTHLS